MVIINCSGFMAPRAKPPKPWLRVVGLMLGLRFMGLVEINVKNYRIRNPKPT